LGHQASLEHRIIEGGLTYLGLPSFGSEQIVAESSAALERLDLGRVGGMILDARVSNGGNSQRACSIISRLIDREVESSRWKTRQYLPAQRSWGQAETWFEAEPGKIPPADGRR
jgi:C-terminal processing protease CtpA/Prc